MGKRVHGLAVWFLYLTALRPGELSLMKREHVEPHQFTVLGKGTKGQRKRIRFFPLRNAENEPLFPEIGEILEEVQSQRFLHRQGYVWPWAYPSVLQEEFRKACVACGIWMQRVGDDGQRYHRTLHTLRGSAEKRWEALGFSDRLIEDLAGHRGAVRQKHYREQQQQAADLSKRIEMERVKNT